VFTLQSFDFSPIKAEIGGRYEHTIINADPSATIGNPAYARAFNAISGSVGASYALSNALKFGVNFAHTERAPSAEELYADGPHAGTQAFEIGNPNFKVERSNGIEATLKGNGPGWNFSLGGYASWFTNYIYEQQTGAVQDDLPVFQSLQAKARYWGVEAEASYKLAQLGGFAINVDGVGDYTNATIPGVGPVPRIPPLRLLGGLEGQSNKLDARVEVERTFAQNRVAPVETTTKGFTLVNASLAFRPWGNDRPESITISANNIFDVEARRHASFLKDYAPLAGRDIRVTLRVGI
jgi:iron complex outermembrane receptor protein